ncbi:phosphoribosylanthranilate isomerase [Sulfurihydrogenibium sp.]|jgi:phosphoribosylanthranilate isomerase|uniref:phosphoribosylanthranilate isomerase n=1 Tax=Sulfurihydrogenibium sp. TaxID=2053621 RepID=UPI0026233818|nr:phosphoribosylanthranilate isomerase [Sulfurihydrogenibium sp.]
MIVKICGITLPSQAKEILEYGADYIGVITYPKSPRYVDIERIKEIKENLKNSKLVAVVVNPSLEQALELLNIADFIQFHGDEDLDFVKKFPKDRVIKAIRVKNESDLEKIKTFKNEDITVLVDAFKEGVYGGTGEMIDLNLLKKITDMYDKVIISGGLSENNLREILNHVKPYGVDASSKLEVSPGVKDLDKVKKFIDIAKNR